MRAALLPFEGSNQGAELGAYFLNPLREILCTDLLDIPDPLGDHEVSLKLAEDPLAMYRYRINSGIVSRSFPSAMLAAIETADLRSWSLKPKSWLKSPFFETAYTSTANEAASCQT